MYSESDLDGAIAAGVLSPEAASAFRDHVASHRLAPAVDEESFRLLTGFNDIFVSIAIGLMLVSVAWLGGSSSVALAGALVAALSWALAEYFTAKRRMALPSILLLLSFVGGVAAALIGALIDLKIDIGQRSGAGYGVGVALIAAGAAWLHWRRFAVPITVAAGALALVAAVVALLASAFPGARDALFAVAFVAGLAVFALAMRWDLSDRQRLTRRSDVAFWLHLAAAPLIAHPLFHLLGIFGGDIGAGQALLVLALYVVFGIVALAVDRRALLVSSLLYVFYALYALFRSGGAIELSAALTGLVIGSALLTLSAFWHPMRRTVVGALGRLGERLPPVQQGLPA